MLVSDVKGRDIKIDSYTLSFHGRLLIEGAEIALNYGQRYGLLGENGSGKVRYMTLLRFFSCLSELSKINQKSPPSFNQSLSKISYFRPTLIYTSSVEKPSPQM